MVEPRVIRLEVPKYQQNENNTCVPSCLQMAIDYLNKLKLVEPTRPLDESEIAKIVKTKTSGTYFNDVTYLNKELNNAVPSLEFIPEFAAHTLADIGRELEDGVPVIVYILVRDSGHEFPHAVIVTGIDDVKKELTYNDPAYGKEMTVSQADFLSMWEKLGPKMIKAKIGRMPRPSLERYMTPQEETI